MLVSAAAEIEELAALHGFDWAVAKPCSTQAILTGAGATFAFSGEAIEILVSGRPSLDCSSDGLLYLLARGLG